MREKIITIDGAEFKIRSLTITEGESLIRELNDTKNGPENGKLERMEDIWGRMVSRALVSPQVEEKDFKSQLDLVVFGKLRDEILDFSGLKAGDSPGEAKAQAI